MENPNQSSRKTVKYVLVPNISCSVPVMVLNKFGKCKPKIMQMLIGCVFLVIHIHFAASFSILSTHQPWRSSLLGSKKEVTVQVEAQLDDRKTKELFAWIHRALNGDVRYTDLMTAIAAVFGDIPELDPMKDYALKFLPKDEEEPIGACFTLGQREEASLGAMGAAQWMGIFQTRPHAILDVRNFQTVNDWVATLPRGCRRTLQKACNMAAGNASSSSFTVTTKTIQANQPAPHSSLSHFRCVLEHEIRLLGTDDFINALAEGISRFMGTTRMVGVIREYRDVNDNTTADSNNSNRILAFAHEIQKGNTLRGQWFYATDEASKRYVWFHSVYELVRRAIETEGIDIVDLGPSGSDAFSDLKMRYGFVSIEDWTSVADYTGPFRYDHNDNNKEEYI
jgi:hypothetical protein